jgi:catechol-2,3-dioxygenase
VKAAKRRLEDNGIEVLGVTDHGFLQSIYFFDPNGVRLELTAYTTTPEEMRKKKAQARASLKAWTDRPR